MITRVHHVGIAVRSIEQAMRFYRDQLGLTVKQRLTLPDRGLHVAFLQAGETKIELLEPFTEDNTVERFLQRRGEGLHHLCFASSDVRAEMARMRVLGTEFIDSEPRPGAEGEVVFIQPACAAGVLVELAEVPASAAAAGQEGP